MTGADPPSWLVTQLVASVGVAEPSYMSTTGPTHHIKAWDSVHAARLVAEITGKWTAKWAVERCDRLRVAADKQGNVSVVEL